MIARMPTSPAAAVAHPAPGPAPPQERIIEAGRRDSRYLLELWHYRELFYFLAWRDILVRYKQTAAGIAWVLIKAMVTLLVLTVVFGRVAQLPSDGVPYPLLVFAAMLPWQFFAGALTDCSNSLVGNGDLISKIYFPRLIVPGSAMIVSLVDFAISCVVLAVLLAWYGFAPDWRILALPLFVVLAAALTFGVGLWFAALTAEYRDFRFIAGFIVQLGLYISPVGFSSSVVPEQLASALFPEPAGRRHRWLPLGDPARHAGSVLARTGDVGRDRIRAACERTVVFPQDRAPVRGRHLARCPTMADVVLNAEGLGKHYLLRHRIAGYDTLREKLGENLRRLIARKRSAPGPREATLEEFWALRDVIFCRSGRARSWA